MQTATSSELAAQALKPYPEAAKAIGHLDRPIPPKILETLLRSGLLPPEVVPMLGQIALAPIIASRAYSRYLREGGSPLV